MTEDELRYIFTYQVPTANGGLLTRQYEDVSKRRVLELKRLAMKAGYSFKIERYKKEEREDG